MYKNLITIVVVLGVIFAAWYVWQGRPVPFVEPSYSASPSPSGSSASTKPSKGYGTTVSYTDALNLFADRKMQFDAVCHGFPPQIVVKNGSKVMFDNRSNDKKTLNINGVNYVFPGYSFRIVNLLSSALPKTVGIDCKSSTGRGENTATVLIEK